MEKLMKQRDSTVILIRCQGLLFNLEFYLVMDFVSLCGRIKFNLLMFKTSGGVEVLKRCHIERNEISCISGLTKF